MIPVIRPSYDSVCCCLTRLTDIHMTNPRDSIQEVAGAISVSISESQDFMALWTYMRLCQNWRCRQIVGMHQGAYA